LNRFCLSAEKSKLSPGAIAFHQKFGTCSAAAMEGKKLTIDFDRAGQKKVWTGL
jgi:hypothetical protein